MDGRRGEVDGLGVLMRLKNGCSGMLGRASWVERIQGEWGAWMSEFGESSLR